MSDKRQCCEVSLQERDCTAPAGIQAGGGGIADGDGTARGVCAECGKRCCSKCSRVRMRNGRRERQCNDCYGDYQSVSCPPHETAGGVDEKRAAYEQARREWRETLGGTYANMDAACLRMDAAFDALLGSVREACATTCDELASMYPDKADTYAHAAMSIRARSNR